MLGQEKREKIALFFEERSRKPYLFRLRDGWRSEGVFRIERREKAAF